MRRHSRCVVGHCNCAAVRYVYCLVIDLRLGMNATLGKTKGSNPALASTVSFSIGTVVCFIVLLVWIKADFRTIDFGAMAKEAPWWSWLGGIMGALIVVVFVLTIPRMGSGTVLAVFVCSPSDHGMYQ